MPNNQTPEKPDLDFLIDDCIDNMTSYTQDSVEYAKMTAQLEKLVKIKRSMRPDRPSADTLAVIAGNLAVALIVIGYEQKHVVTTKVLPFLAKVR